MVPKIDLKSELANYGLWDKIVGLTLVQSTTDAYSTIRSSNWVLSTGMAMMEKSVALSTSPALSMLLFVVNKCPQKVTSLDKMACNYFDMLEVGCLVASGSAGEMAHNIKVNIQTAALKTARKTCSSSPGQLILGGLDTVIKASERALDFINEEYVVTSPAGKGDVTPKQHTPDAIPEVTTPEADEKAATETTPATEDTTAEKGEEDEEGGEEEKGGEEVATVEDVE